MNKVKSIIGIDYDASEDVDFICHIEKICDLLKPNISDIVIMNDVLEHLVDWRIGVNTIKYLCKINGYILVTVPGLNFPYHQHPGDYWRFTKEDFSYIFSDTEIIDLFEVNDRSPPYNFQGVCLFCRKLTDNIIDLSNYNVFKM